LGWTLITIMNSSFLNVQTKTGEKVKLHYYHEQFYKNLLYID
jgi:hypothetical protein